ncbi:MAG: nuclear transport factor 2 family protein [Gemmatimonadaceae bacterium]
MRRLLLLVCAAGSVVACDAAPNAESLTASHAAAIRDSVHAMLADFQRLSVGKQWDSVSALYVSDSTLRWIENGRVVMKSSDAVKRTFGSLPKTTSIETTFDTLEITPVAPGVACVLAYYHTAFNDATRGSAAFGGLLTMTIVHRPEGWRFLNGHTSTPPKA